MQGKFKIGDQVKLLAPHSWAGEVGEIISFEVLGLLPHLGPRPRIAMQNGMECFCTRDSEMLKLSCNEDLDVRAFDEASNHPEECNCENCQEWHRLVGPEE